MSQRDAEKIAHLIKEKANQNLELDSVQNQALAAIPQDSPKASMDFPRPTKLTEIIATISKWQQYTIIIEPKLDRNIQIFSSQSLTREDAFKVFLATLQAVGLRAVFLGPNTFKISELPNAKRQV